MSWQDRDYNDRDYGGGRLGNGLMALMNGSAPLGTWFGIRVRVHAALIFFMAWMILVPWHGKDHSTPWAEAAKFAALSMGILFVTVLLHEFGHCVAARLMGGSADDILMWPLGGLAFTNPPHRPWPTFVTVAGGPLVNVLICLVTGAALVLINSTASVLPLNPFAASNWFGWHSASFYLWYFFFISFSLLLFNLLPIFPLDGGQMLQSILWPGMGYYRSMNFSCITGMIGAGVLTVVGLATWNWLLIAVALAGFMYCYQRRNMLREMGPELGDGSGDFTAGFQEESPIEHHKRRRLSKRTIRKVRKRAAEEQAEQARIDAILAKVSAHGMHSLTWRERRTLRKATERQREHDLELSRNRDD